MPEVRVIVVWAAARFSSEDAHNSQPIDTFCTVRSPFLPYCTHLEPFPTSRAAPWLASLH